ncbi:NAD-dependent epimerase/dehydratase family protein [Streptomyces sp. IMTB 1903]|uniref:NAD-dependent epimerase/dehydratase family protein n=1 Tax=Streptomyces sp. IMTB 1903 TaxID=1776680 RepID=UPI000752E853|nr:NAD-dependent epimerase/dehydratase [Streptomyces sp. IMTB 1903]
MAGSRTPAARPLVTVLGASGYIGSSVVALLRSRPVRLRTVSRRPCPVAGDGLAELDVRTADLTAPGAVADAVAGSDAVIHLVTHRSATGDWRTRDGDPEGEHANVTVTLDLVESLGSGRTAGPPPAVIYASTVLPPGGPAPANTYERQKLASERILRAACAAGSLRGVVLRLPTVYGHGPVPGDLGRGVVAAMVRRGFACEPLTMWHDGTIERDLLHVDDAARAFLSALDHADALTGRHWDVGCGLGHGLGDVFRTIAEIIGRHTGRPPVPVLRVDPPDGATGLDFRSVRADSSAFRSVTGWAPRAVLRDALEQVVAAHAVSTAHAPTPKPHTGPSAKEGIHL